MLGAHMHKEARRLQRQGPNWGVTLRDWHEMYNPRIPGIQDSVDSGHISRLHGVIVSERIKYIQSLFEASSKPQNLVSATGPQKSSKKERTRMCPKRNFFFERTRPPQSNRVRMNIPSPSPAVLTRRSTGIFIPIGLTTIKGFPQLSSPSQRRGRSR